MFRGVAPYTIDELESYHYPAPEDADPDQNVKDQLPVQQNDHALDADRYISVMTHTGGAKRKPTAPNDGERKKVSEHDRILQLMRNKSNKSEVWS